MARKAQQLRSILWLYGKSGGGKGMTANLIKTAFGRYAASMQLDQLERRQNDIDAAMADLLEADPCIITCDELGGSSVKQRKFYGLTGNSEFQARRPHGKTIKRTLRALWIAPTVRPPKLNVDEGMERRSAAIGFERKYEGTNPNEHFDQDELDALVTWAALEARHVYLKGYEAPLGNVRRRAMLLRAADHLHSWIEDLPDTYQGMTTEDTWKEYLEEEEANREMKLNAFAMKVNASSRWETWKPPGRGTKSELRRKKELLFRDTEEGGRRSRSPTSSTGCRKSPSRDELENSDTRVDEVGELGTTQNTGSGQE